MFYLYSQFKNSKISPGNLAPFHFPPLSPAGIHFSQIHSKEHKFHLVYSSLEVHNQNRLRIFFSKVVYMKKPPSKKKLIRFLREGINNQLGFGSDKVVFCALLSNHKENKSTVQCTVHLYSLLIDYLMADFKDSQI